MGQGDGHVRWELEADRFGEKEGGGKVGQGRVMKKEKKRKGGWSGEGGGKEG